MTRLFAFVLVAMSAAQDFRGGVSGTVTDGTGGVLPGVTIDETFSSDYD